MIVIVVLLALLIPAAAAAGVFYARQASTRSAGSIEARAATVLAEARRDVDGPRARDPRARGGGAAGPAHHHPGHPAARIGADRRIDRRHAGPALRRHEGPHHRP